MISEQYGFGQLMSERRLILVNNHLTKPFPEVFILRLRYFWVTSFSKEDRWSHSTPTEWANK